MAENSRHITIQKGKQFPQMKKCTKCCKNFHCPFCAVSIFKPTKLSKFKEHLKSHCNKAVIHGDFTFHRCGLGCRPALHFHCLYCSSTIIRKPNFENHLQVCKHRKHSEADAITPSSTSTEETPIQQLDTPAITNTPSTTSTAETVTTSINTPSTTTTALPIINTPSTTTTALPIINTPSTTTTALPIINTPSTTTTALTILNTPSTTTSVAALPTIDTASFTNPDKDHVKPVVKKTCPMCHILINKKNLQKHIERKHPDQSALDIDDTFQLTSQCIDQTNGIFTVLKVIKGRTVPVHVQYKTWGENQSAICESTECQFNVNIAQKSGITTYQCMHVSAASFCKSLAEQVSLREDILTEMVRGKWFSVKKKKQCLDLQQLANSRCVPLSVHTSIGIPLTKKFISVFEPSVSSYSCLGRVMVVYNTKLNTWNCPCTRLRHSCVHKYIAKWHLFQTQRELLSSPHNNTLSEEDSLLENSNVYPPNGHGMEIMVNYMLQYKKIPAVLSEDMRTPLKDYPQCLFPSETECQECTGNVQLGDPILITQKAKILTTWCIIEDVSTYCKQCPQCGMFYRYQEWKDRLHNFNDHIILELSLCITFRNHLQAHTSVSRVVEFLQLMTGVAFPPPDTILHAYLHFEALTDHEYKYSCPSCGDHPPVVIMGLYEHRGSHLSEDDIEEPAENFKGEVNLERFWETLSKQMICQGLVANGAHNPFAIPVNYHFWAPWIGKNTRHSDTVLNTEFEKVCASTSPSEILEMTVTEDRLTEELFKQTDGMIRSLCIDCGVDSTGSRSDMFLRLANNMKSRQTYETIYKKVWSASGGWGVIMCPCGIVYSLKCNLRAESPRDFADLLLSWKHMPNVMVYDFAQGLATHMNLRAPEKLPISPFEGRLLEPTQENIELARCGHLKVSLPWLEEKTGMIDPHGHPVTGSPYHYVLCDSLSEGRDSRDALRKLTLVPQLAGKVSSEVAEQLFAKMKENNYFLNTSLPSTRLFQMRNIIHHYNENKAKEVSIRSTESLGSSLLTDGSDHPALDSGESRSTDVMESSILSSLMALSSV